MNKQVYKRMLRDMVADAGWVIEQTNGGHFRLRGPSGAVVFCPCTPRDCERTLLNTRAQMRGPRMSTHGDIILTCDLECYFDQEYSLKRMPTPLYIRDPRWKLFGWAVKVNGNPSKWLAPATAKKFFDKLDWSKVTLYGQNLQFDAMVLAEKYGKVPARYVDSLGLSRAVHGVELASHSLDSFSKHMGFEGKLEGGQALARVKGKRTLTRHEWRELGAYAIQDNDLTHACIVEMLKNFPEGKLRSLDWTIRMATQPRLWLDRDVLANAYNEELQRKKDILLGLEVEPKMLRSGDKFAALLRKAGVEPPTKVSKVTGKVTYAFAKNDEDFVDLQEHEDPYVRALVTGRLGFKSSIMETRLKHLLDLAETDRPMPVMLGFSGAQQTHRLSGQGRLNQQNLPNGGMIRRSIVGLDDEELIVSDSSQIECRVNAALARQQNLLKMFANGDDPYSWFASQIFGIKITKKTAKKDSPHFIPGHDRFRFIGKVAVLSLGYGAGFLTFRRMVWQQSGGTTTLTDKEAQSIVALYRKTFSNIAWQWQVAQSVIHSMAYVGKTDDPLLGLKEAEVISQVLTPMYARQCIMLPSGLVLRYPDLRHDTKTNEYTFRQGKKRTRLYGPKLVENWCQSLAAEVIMDQVSKMLDRQILPALQVHDEVVVVAKDYEAAQIAKSVEQIMKTAPSWWPDLPVSCETHRVKCYADAK